MEKSYLSLLPILQAVVCLGLGVQAQTSRPFPLPQPGWERSSILRELYPTWEEEVLETKDAGEPLLLSPLIAEGHLEDARSRAAVTYSPIASIAKSYSGFLTVDPEHNSNLFFWFFPAEREGDPKEIPLLLWLQGGPGATSLFGLFEEIGPFSIKDNSSFVPNPYSWHKNHSLLFIDNPVGTGFAFSNPPLATLEPLDYFKMSLLMTHLQNQNFLLTPQPSFYAQRFSLGFSFTDDDDGYATKQEEISRHLYTALLDFFKLFAEYQSSPFYLTGESYAGKHIPGLGMEIHNRNADADIWINLKGLAVGNGFTDPGSMLRYSEFLYQLGLVDTVTYKRMQLVEQYGALHMAEEKYIEAYFDMLLDLVLFKRNANFSNVYHVGREHGPSLEASFAGVLQSPEVRAALHVGGVPFSSVGKVYGKLTADFMRSEKHHLEALLPHYRVLYFTGQYDIIVAYPLARNMFESLKFNGSERYRVGTRENWIVDGLLAGYIKRGGNFIDVLVRNAGHMVPADQPRRALQLAIDFFSGRL